jgi:hypothetical protein
VSSSVMSSSVRSAYCVIVSPHPSPETLAGIFPTDLPGTRPCDKLLRWHLYESVNPPDFSRHLENLSPTRWWSDCDICSNRKSLLNKRFPTSVRNRESEPMDLCALVPHRAARLSASSCGASTQQELAGALCAYAQALSHKSNRIAI